MDPNLKEEALQILKRLNNEKKKHVAATVLNSPFFLTVVGGIILTLISTAIATKTSKDTEIRQRHQTLLNLKTAEMREFSDGVVRFLQSSYGMRKREIWLSHNQDNKEDDDLEYFDGRSFEETRDFYESQRKSFDQLAPADGLCARARAMFADSAEIDASIGSLDETLDDYIGIPDNNALALAFDKASDLHEEIVALMGENIKNHRSTHEN